MADIFISYKREDRPRIAPLAQALEAQGYTVWWDLDLIAGQRWDKTIRAELAVAKCVIVAWTHQSVAEDQSYVSEYVELEAGEGHRRAVLLPVLLDAGRVAWRHQLLHYADLVGWPDNDPHPGMDDLKRGVAAYAGARERPQDLELGAWNAAVAAKTTETYRAFVAAHPASRFVDLARARASELAETGAWLALGETPPIADLAAFLRRFPAGRFGDARGGAHRRFPGSTDAAVAIHGRGRRRGLTMGDDRGQPRSTRLRRFPGGFSRRRTGFRGPTPSSQARRLGQG